MQQRVGFIGLGNIGNSNVTLYRFPEKTSPNMSIILLINGG
jgi:hypothetical protein